MVVGALPSSRLLTNTNAGFCLSMARRATCRMSLACRLVRLPDLLERLERLHRLLVGATLAQQGTHDAEIRRLDAGPLELCPQLRHPRPGVEHMGHAMLGQAGEIARLQVLGVADLDAVAEAARAAPEEVVEPVEEVIDAREGRLGEGAELEDERPPLAPRTAPAAG